MAEAEEEQAVKALGEVASYLTRAKEKMVRGDFAASLTAAREAVSLASSAPQCASDKIESEKKLLLSEAFILLAQALTCQESPLEEASAAYSSALEQLTTLLDKSLRSSALHLDAKSGQASIHLLRTEFSKAAELFQEIHDTSLSETLGKNLEAAARASGGMGKAMLGLRQFEQAGQWYGKMRKEADELLKVEKSGAGVGMMVESCYGEGMACVEAGNAEKGLAVWSMGIEMAKSCGKKDMVLLMETSSQHVRELVANERVE